MGVLHGKTTTTDFAPGMRVVIRGEERMVRKVVTNSLSKKTLHSTGVSMLVKDREAMFFADAEEIEQVDPSNVRLRGWKTLTAEDAIQADWWSQ